MGNTGLLLIYYQNTVSIILMILVLQFECTCHAKNSSQGFNTQPSASGRALCQNPKYYFGMARSNYSERSERRKATLASEL